MKMKFVQKARQTIALNSVGVFLDVMAGYGDLHAKEPVHCLAAVLSNTHQLSECAGLHFETHESAERHLQATHGLAHREPAQQQVSIFKLRRETPEAN